MSRVAVFVDAGYLFAQGSTALTGSKKPRSDLKLNETAAMAELTGVAAAKSNNAPLLRVYWYDGARGSSGLTLEHATLAHTDYLKLKLGFMNNQGEQKGVDSLIVTDLIELARNHAITDAVLLSGDEDVRVGVQIAQSFGLCVHLLGIVPSRGSQSPQLMQEADTTTEWDAATVGRFLSVKPSAVIGMAASSSSATAGTGPSAPIVPAVLTTVVGSMAPARASALDTVVAALVATLDSNDVAGLVAYWTAQRGVPPEYDGKLIARCRTEIGSDLTPTEKRYVRTKFTADVRARSAVA